MRHISVDPPPFFHRGPSPLARLAFFGLLSLALLFTDTRYRYLENVRQVAAVVLYPLQRAVQFPGEALAYVGAYFVVAAGRWPRDNALLKQQLLADAPIVQALSAARAGEREAACAARPWNRAFTVRRRRPKCCTPGATRTRRRSSSTAAPTQDVPRRQPGGRRGGHRRPGDARASAASPRSR